MTKLYTLLGGMVPSVFKILVFPTLPRNNPSSTALLTLRTLQIPKIIEQVRHEQIAKLGTITIPVMRKKKQRVRILP